MAQLRAFVRRPRGNEITLGYQKLDCLDGIGKDKRILPKEFLDLIKTSRLDAWCRLAVADDARRNQIIERVGLTAVPRVKETPDHGLVLLDRCTHGEGTSLMLPTA